MIEIPKIWAGVITFFITLTISMLSYIYVEGQNNNKEFQQAVVIEMMYNRVQFEVILQTLQETHPDIRNRIMNELELEKDRSYYLRGGTNKK